MKKITYIFIALFSLSLISTSCREQKTTEEKIEESIDEAGDAVEDAADEVEDAVES